MSKYTTEVRFICETAAGLKASVGYDDVDGVISKAIPSVFSFSFPIFDETYRETLETKILKHYYTREIAFESVGLWKLKLDTRLNEIMPYYNQLYSSTLLEFNPLYDVDLTTDHKLTREEKAADKGTSKTTDKFGSTTDVETETDTSTEYEDASENNGTQTGTSSGTNYDKYSDTPQGSLTNVQNDTYLTNARMVTDSGNTSATTSGTTSGNGSGSSNTTTNSSTDVDSSRTVDGSTTNDRTVNSLDDYVEHVKGKTGGASYASRVKEFRETFLNIDMMVIEELADLFFNLW